MQAIKQCYLAFINNEAPREPHDLDEILGDARAMLSVKEYAALDAGSMITATPCRKKPLPLDSANTKFSRKNC